MHLGNRAFLLAIALTATLNTAAHGQTTMSFRFKEGDKLNYVMEQKTKTVMSIAGADIEMKVNATVIMAWQVVKVESNGSAVVKVKVTHSKMSLDSPVGNAEVDSKDKDIPNDVVGKPLGQMNKVVAAMEISATMLPTGALKDVKVSDETVRALKAIPGAEKLGDMAHPDNFQDMISAIVFPTGAVSKGKSWTHKTETQSPAGKISAENTFTLEGTVEKDGVTLEKIALVPSIKIEANPKAEMKVKSITGTGYTLFDNKAGLVVESNMKQTKKGTVSAMGLVLDQISEETTTIRLQKQTAEAKNEAAKSVASIKVNEDEYVDKVVNTELLETLPGVSRSFTLERSFVQSVTITGTAATDKALAGEINALVGKSLDVTLGKKVTVKETIALDGKETTKVNVVWVERSRSGVATRADGSTVPFAVKVGLRLKLEKAK